jgi:hypothetical protein
VAGFGTTVLHGKVGQGQGYASGLREGGLWLRSPVFSKMIGSPIYPASINVFIAATTFDLMRTRHPYFRQDDEELRPEGVRKRGCLVFRPCLINGDRAFVLRTEHPGPTHSGKKPPPIPPPHTMFEIAATKKLSWVRYGAPVELEIDLNREPEVRLTRARRP